MPAAILSPAQWSEVHSTAVALGCIQAAADAHGVSREAAYKRAQREGWLVGNPERVEAARAERIDHAAAAGIVLSKSVQRRTSAEVLDSAMREDGHATRSALARVQRRAAEAAATAETPISISTAQDLRALTEATMSLHGDGATAQPHIRLRVVAAGCAGAGARVAAEVEIGSGEE